MHYNIFVFDGGEGAGGDCPDNHLIELEAQIPGWDKISLVY